MSTFLLSVNLCHAVLDWKISNTTIPRESGAMIGGYSSSNLIWLLGGEPGLYQQLVALNPSNLDSSSSPFIVNETNGISVLAFAYAQSYTQINDIIYMADPDTGNRLSIFNMSSQQFTGNYLLNSMPYSYGPYGSACFTHIDHYLIITGGYAEGIDYVGPLPYVQIYDVNSNSWSTGPNLTTPRSGHACQYNPFNQHLYVIGGIGSQREDTVSKLLVSNMENVNESVWIELNHKLSQNRSSLRAVFYEDYILVIGGLNSNVYSNYVDKILLNDDIIAETSLPIGVAEATVIIANAMLFVMGGRTASSQYLNTIQYAALPTIHPTTFMPTTYYPTTNTPTINYPTSLTKNPSAQSTQVPTGTPSETTILSTEYTKDNDARDSAASTSVMTSVYITISVVVVTITCVVLVMIIVYSRKKREKAESNNKQMEVQQINSVNSAQEQPGGITLESWLNNVGLTKYYTVFVENGFGDGHRTNAALFDLNDDDLMDIGITNKEHRKLILNQIKQNNLSENEKFHSHDSSDSNVHDIEEMYTTEKQEGTKDLTFNGNTTSNGNTDIGEIYTNEKREETNHTTTNGNTDIGDV